MDTSLGLDSSTVVAGGACWAHGGFASSDGPGADVVVVQAPPDAGEADLSNDWDDLVRRLREAGL